MNYFPFAWEEEGSAENLVENEEDEGFSEQKTPVRESSSEPPAMDPRPAARFIENLQKM